MTTGTAIYAILALSAKLGAAMAFNVTFMFTAQLYPTSIRFERHRLAQRLEVTIADAGTQQWVCAALWPGLEAWWLLGSAATSPTRLSLRTLCQSSCLSVSLEASASLAAFVPSFSPSPLASLCRTPSKILSRSRREENQSGNVERNQKHSQKVDAIRWHRHKYSRARTWQVVRLVFSNITKKIASKMLKVEMQLSWVDLFASCSNNTGALANLRRDQILADQSLQQNKLNCWFKQIYRTIQNISLNQHEILNRGSHWWELRVDLSFC